MGGRGRGRGRGRGGKPNASNDEASNTAAISQLNQAAKDIQKMLGDCELSRLALFAENVWYSTV